MRFGIVIFPGTWSDIDCHYALKDTCGQDARYIWHKETSLVDFDCVVLPGGFSYGDYLRCGAIARFSPVMAEVEKFAAAGKPVIGICNGFQILCEAHLLPGVLMRNEHLEYRCQWVNLRVDNNRTSFSRACRDGQVIRVPISHYEGNYFTDAETLQQLEEEQRVVFRYSNAVGVVSRESNPNGALNNIAGIMNRNGNVLGMMPHPERACEPLLGGADGNLIWESIFAGR
jgi:phosphoribosylformylglycinamidine synthase